jgi:FtsH-binding integral membrane protein
MNNRGVYAAWGVAWLVGYGSYAVSGGADPVLSLPSLVPVAALVTGLLAAFVVTIIATARAARGVTGPAALPGRLLGGAWAIGFTALFLLITALGRTLGDHHVETLMWPAGSALVVGLLYLMGGAVHRDTVQYVLGTYLALVSTAAVFLDTPGLYWVLATAGVGGYAVAAVIEHRRHRAQA